MTDMDPSVDLSPTSYFAQASTAVASWLGVSPQAVASCIAVFAACLVALLALPFVKRFYKGDAAAAAKMVVLIVCYSLCSSLLLIINKVAVTYVPAASTILLCQLASCAIFVKGMGTFNFCEVEPIVYSKAKKFMVLVLAFVAILFTNVKALQFNPVDTLICFRASTPLVIAVVEFIFLGRELPSLRSWGSLVGVLLGVVLYVRQDMHFGIVPYLWLGAWYFFAIFDMVLVKHICDTVEMNTWTRTYYQNALAVVPVVVLAVLDKDWEAFQQPVPAIGVWAMVLSCVAGLGMSYFSFALRASISATSFSVIGNVCKVLTILVNLLIWDQHSDALGTVALFFCLIMGSFYKQAPMRHAKGSELPAYAKAAADKHKS